MVAFFASLGFACPPRKEVPAFVQEVTSAVGQRELAEPALRARCQPKVRAWWGRCCSHYAGSCADTGLRPVGWLRVQAGLLVSLAEVEAAFWGAEHGPGADMRQLVADAPGPEGFADLPPVRHKGSGGSAAARGGYG